MLGGLDKQSHAAVAGEQQPFATARPGGQVALGSEKRRGAA